MLNLLGTGVYHTSIELDYGDGTPALEYAFGAHDLKGFTGIFSVQAGTAPSRMPGLRGPPFHRLELGSAFQGRDWTRAKEQQRKEMREHKEQQRAARRSGGTGARDSSSRTTLYTLGSIGSGNGDQGKSTQATASSSASVNSSSTALKGQDEAPGGPSSPSGSGERASLAPELYQEQDDDDDDVEEESDGDGDEIESGMERLSPDARRAWRLVARFKRDPKWHGTAYRLLERFVRSRHSHSRSREAEGSDVWRTGTATTSRASCA